MTIIRALWSGKDVAFKGKYYTVTARLYEPPATPIPLMTAANGPKAMQLAGKYGDGLITDPKTWLTHKQLWQDAARAAGKDPAAMHAAGWNCDSDRKIACFFFQKEISTWRHPAEQRSA